MFAKTLNMFSIQTFNTYKSCSKFIKETVKFFFPIHKCHCLVKGLCAECVYKLQNRETERQRFPETDGLSGMLARSRSTGFSSIRTSPAVEACKSNRKGTQARLHSRSTLTLLHRD